MNFLPTVKGLPLFTSSTSTPALCRGDVSHFSFSSTVTESVNLQTTRIDFLTYMKITPNMTSSHEPESKNIPISTKNLICDNVKPNYVNTYLSCNLFVPENKNLISFKVTQYLNFYLSIYNILTKETLPLDFDLLAIAAKVPGICAESPSFKNFYFF